MTWRKRLAYWFFEEFVSIDHLNVVMKEQYLARNCIVARYDQKFIDMKEDFDEIDKISVGMQMERQTNRADIDENIAELKQLHEWYTSAIGRVRQLEISMIEKR